MLLIDKSSKNICLFIIQMKPHNIYIYNKRYIELLVLIAIRLKCFITIVKEIESFY